MIYALLFVVVFVVILPALIVHFGAISRGPAVPYVALTIDDGPNPSTPALLAALAEHAVPATFFCIAQKCEHMQLSFAGHELQNHSYSHSSLLAFWPVARAQRELRRAQDVLSHLGSTPRYFRAVAGVLSPPLYRAAKRLGLQCVHWTASARDGGPIAVSEAVALRRLSRGLVPGGILVIHDREHAAAWIAPLKRAADVRGLRFVLLSELLSSVKTASSPASP